MSGYPECTPGFNAITHSSLSVIGIGVTIPDTTMEPG
jgi:hypothetical protein